MEIEQLQSALDDLAKRVETKGYALPGAYCIINSHGEPNVALQAKDEQYENIASTIYHADGDTLDLKLADAADWISRQPDPVARDMQTFMRALGGVIDKGRALGVDVDFLNPLTETMKRLSEKRHHGSEIGNRQAPPSPLTHAGPQRCPCGVYSLLELPRRHPAVGGFFGDFPT